MDSEVDEVSVFRAVMSRARQLVQDEEPEMMTGIAHIPQVDSIASPPATEPSNRLFALLIGVDKYKYQKYKDLQGAVRDTHHVEDYLREQRPPVAAARIKKLANEHATTAKIVETIESIGKHVCKDNVTCEEDAVHKDDPILIYYAGHGCNIPKPEEWPSASSHIQCLALHDARVEGDHVTGVITDRAFGALLKGLADARGNHITVILDCCHSGSGTRNDDSIARGIEFKDGDTSYTVSASYQQELWDNENDVYDREANEERGIAHTAAFANRGLQSHVLLAACSPEETAYEDCATREGRFTSALLKLLRRAGPDTMTYSQVIKNLDVLPSQTPQCEGHEKDTRIVFDSGLFQQNRRCYDVVASKASYVVCAGRDLGVKKGDIFAIYRDKEAYASVAPALGKLVIDAVGADASSTLPVDNFDLRVLDDVPQPVAILVRDVNRRSSGAGVAQNKRTYYGIAKSTYTLRAGQIHGVSEGDVFSVYKDKTASHPPAELMVTSVKAVTSLMAPVEGTNMDVLGDTTDAVAVLSRVGKLDVFRVHVDVKQDQELCELVAKALAKEAFTPTNLFGRSIMLSPAKSASVSIVPASNDTIEFVILDSRITGLGLKNLSGTVVRKETPLRAALRSAAHFFYHLGSSPSPDQQGLRKAVSVGLWEMVESMDEEALVPMPVCRRGAEVADFKTSGAFRPKLYQTKDGEDDSDEPSYGMDVTLSPNAQYDLFVWLFYFDCSTLEIVQYYSPPVVKDNKDAAPLRQNVKDPLPLNYGDAGSTPFIFELPSSLKRDVGFMRLFISTHNTDLSSIKQAPVVELGRGSVPVLSNKFSVQGWDAISFPVVLEA